MKKTTTRLISLGLLTIASLLSCSGNNNIAPFYTLDDKGEVSKSGEVPIYYPKNKDVPYISLADGIAIANELRSSTFDDKKYQYKMSQNEDAAVIVDEKGTEATVDVVNQQITINNFDSFAVGYYDDQLPLMPVGINKDTKSIKLVKEESSYKAGEAVVFDFKNYPSITLERGKADEGLLIPLAIFNDIFITGGPGFKGLTYNYNNFYLAPEIVSLSTGTLSKIGKHYYETAPVRKEISKELASYVYDETMFAFDHFYGMKGIRKINSFKEFVKEKGLENDMLSGNIEKMNAAYATLSYKCLEDGHTAYLSPSFFTDLDHYKTKNEWKSKKMLKKQAENLQMDEARRKDKINKPFEVIDDTAFIFFDDFMEIDEAKLYSSSYTEEDIRGNNTLLFAYAYKEIKKNPNIKNVVIDLVTNNGGDATGLVYCLGTLIGKHYIDLANPLTGSLSHLTFETDINVDGKIDENDVPLCEDYNIYMLDSKFAFSCGNLFPVAAKYNNDDVTILGDRTGGGTCVVSTTYNAFGAYIVRSGLMMLTKETETGYTHIEDGAEVDIPIDYDEMLNRNYIVNVINAGN